MDCIVHEVAKSWTRLSDFRFHFCFMPLILSEGIRLPEPALQGASAVEESWEDMAASLPSMLKALISLLLCAFRSLG